MSPVAGRVESATEQANLRAIADATTDFALLVPTATGLTKSILDAIAPLRDLFERTGYHSFTEQRQGLADRVRRPAQLVSRTRAAGSVVSLYRPLTKSGDPRLWFTGLGAFASPNDLLAVVVANSALVVFNVSTSSLAFDIDRDHPSAEREILDQLSLEQGAIARELLGLLQVIGRRGPIKAIGTGDTSIGRTLETLLGIKINSSKNPDYKGIELKSNRAGLPNRKTLFAQVPDWNLSGCRSSHEILRSFGYVRGGYTKLYVTVRATGANAQGLRLLIDGKHDELHEISNRLTLPIVAVWPFGLLRARLLHKHRETFWVSADSVLVGGREHFLFRSVLHTRRPVAAQLEPLIADGSITMDHLIKDEGGRVIEKGPLFKTNDRGLGLLFPRPLSYILT